MDNMYPPPPSARMAHCLASEIFHLSQNISQNISENISEDPKDPKDPNSSHLDPDSSHLDPKWMKVKSSAERRGEGTEQKTQKPSISISTSDLSSSSYDQSLR